ncbi:hypothetical protein [Dietzia sp. CH92]|uniref:hypothetical protein n=1 Tax=Dietzia sp. CH92 TaxID=3051823 RepID=UPI0028D3D49F|nr:hypothetical protein [Dietzia sp. CH92]
MRGQSAPGRVRLRVGHAGLVAALTATLISAAAVVGASAWASPSASTSLSFDVVDPPGGGLHLAVAPDGGLALPPGGSAEELPLPRAVVHDNRGGGTRDWSASVAAVGGAETWEASYRVTALTSPGTGATLNRMPGWTRIRTTQEAVVSTGITGLAESSSWAPSLRVTPSGARGALVTSVL